MNAWSNIVSQKRAKGFVIWIILSCFLFLASPLAAQKKSKKKKDKEEQNIVLADGEVSRYRIVIPASATAHELKASTVLLDYLLQISGAAIPIVAAEQGRSRY